MSRELIDAEAVCQYGVRVPVTIGRQRALSKVLVPAVRAQLLWSDSPPAVEPHAEGAAALLAVA